MSQSAGSLIDRALSRHWAFTNVSEGSALAFLDERQRAKLLQIIKTAEELLGETSEIKTSGTGLALVGLDANGNPFYTTTVDDGYALNISLGVPYIDVSDRFVVDPFGASAGAIPDGTPGFPLPDDMLRLVSVSAMTTDSTIIARRIDVLPQELAQRAPIRLALRAYMSANRLIPIRTDPGDLWSTVTSIRLGFVRCPALVAMTDELVIPSQCMGSLTADLCDFFALQSEKCPEADKTRFAANRQAAELDMIANVTSLEGIVSSTVIYKK